MGLSVTPWWQTLKIRSEILHSSGAVDDVQMSLFQAVHGVGDYRPAYAEATYYGEITHPSPQFIDLLAKVAVRLGGGEAYTAAPALWRLDQAMGGGKSHGLIGLYHLAANPTGLGRTDVGRQALAQADQIAGRTVPADLGRPHVVVLACDSMTPGKGVQEFDGPAQTLHERFLWRLFNKDYALYERYRPFLDKAKLADALKAVGRPVLILVDEIMDYVRQLSDRGLHDLAVKDMAFLRALLDAINDVRHVAMVVVMIASEKDNMDLDTEGLSRRGELDQLLVRNGKPATINDNTDFAAILRRRLFEGTPPAEVLAATADLFARTMTGPWKVKAFDQISAPWTREWSAEVARCYPFHPQLIALAEQEWAKLAGFQRVRSTIRIFAATVYEQARRAEAEGWAPLLIGAGDLPLYSPTVREAVIGSGLIGDTRTQANYRQLASTDIVATDDHNGSARTLDRERGNSITYPVNPRAAERAATCLFLCSVVGSRGGGRQGATEAELKAATFVPDAAFGYADADAVISELKDVENGGLASVEQIPGRGGQAARLFMSTKQTLNMLVRAARGTVTDEERDAEVARAAERLTGSGPFKERIFIEADLGQSPRDVLVTAGIDDARATRLVVLDPAQFSLRNGAERETIAAVCAAMGIGPHKLPVTWASSAVYAVANTQRRAGARGAAGAFLAWDRVTDMVDVKNDEELTEKARAERAEARRSLDRAVKLAYQHVMYLGPGEGDDPRTDYTITLEHENQTALDGTTVWKALLEVGKVFDVGTFSGKALVHNLRDDDYGRPLDEVRDLFWSAPRMPLLPGGESDLQRAIYDAVRAGTLRLVGADGDERTVTSPGEIGVGQSSLRLARPVPAEATVKSHEGAATGGITIGDGTGDPAASEDDPGPGIAGQTAAATNTTSPSSGGATATAESEVSFSLMGLSLNDDTNRDALYSLFQALANRVDEGTASFAQVQLRIRVNSEVSGGIADLVRALGAVPAVREV